MTPHRDAVSAAARDTVVTVAPSALGVGADLRRRQAYGSTVLPDGQLSEPVPLPAVVDPITAVMHIDVNISTTIYLLADQPPHEVTLHLGWNLVSWSGPDHTAANLLAPTGVALSTTIKTRTPCGS